MAGRSYLGIDLGTSMVKAAIFDENGDALAVAGRPAALMHERGGVKLAVEQDFGVVLETMSAVVADAIREAAAAGAPAPSSIALTGQGDGCWVVDERFRPVRPALSWLDGRAGPLVDEWSRNGVLEGVYRVSGGTMFPGAPAALFKWLDENEPQTLDRAATVGYLKDAIFGRLTGRRATDPSDASMPFGDGTGTGYSDEVLKLTGLEHRRDLLAPIEAPVPVGELTEDGTSVIGLPVGTPVTCGPFDFPACGFGAGVAQPGTEGDALMIVGTTLGCMVHRGELVTSGEPAGFSVSTGYPDHWLRAMPAMVGTASLDWTLRVLGIELSAVEGLLGTSPPGANGVNFLPYLSVSGERAPFVDPLASGQISGLRLTINRDDIVRSVCEGLAYTARHCFEVAGRSGRIVVAGGGAKSSNWMQMFADVLEVPLELARNPEVGARGAVLAGAQARGEELDAERWTKPEGLVEPRDEFRALYDDGFRHQMELLEGARPLWHTKAAPEPAQGTPEGAPA
jgi:erythritol kinase (D-erythritol 1-phosphate-forming)